MDEKLITWLDVERQLKKLVRIKQIILISYRPFFVITLAWRLSTQVSYCLF